MRAILIGVTTKYDKYNIEYSLDELKNLAKTLNYDCVSSFSQKLDKPNSKTYIGIGKLSEVKEFVITNNIDIAIFNDEMSPSQLKNVSELLEIEVIDRTYLILQIFEQRAKSETANLEIKLAKDIYLLPRITLEKGEESRIGGGSSTKTRGKGETSQELNRRHLLAEISSIKDKLNKVTKDKESHMERIKKNRIPVVALVGYTNAGKSSTMNSIINFTNKDSKSEVYAKDELFATLFTYNRKITWQKLDFMLVDTIGFISKLPTSLVNSFYQTLYEVKNADLIIHVIDSSSEYINEQIHVVLETLHQLNADKIPEIMLFNKYDKTLYPDIEAIGYKSIHYSNITKQGITELLDTIRENVAPSFIHARVLIPYDKGNLIDFIEKRCTIEKRSFENNGCFFELEIPKDSYNLFKDYDLDFMVS